MDTGAEKRGQARVPVSTALDETVIERARRYCLLNGLTLGRVVDEALQEYLSPRELDPSTSPLARYRRQAGRPSRAKFAEEEGRRQGLLKRTGRPVKQHRRRPDGAELRDIDR